MTHAASQDALASASTHLMAAQLRLVDDPEYASVLRVLNDVRAELQRSRLRVLPGGCGNDYAPNGLNRSGA